VGSVFSSLAYGMAHGAFLGFDNWVNYAVQVLAGDMPAWDVIVNTVSSVLRPFALTIIAICLLIEIAQVSAKVDMLKWEHGLKLAVKMVFARVAIDIAPLFLRATYAQAAQWIGGLMNFGTEAEFGRRVLNDLSPLVQQTTGTFDALGLFVFMLIPLLALQICGLVIVVIAYGRMFELYIYLAVSPIPMAFFPLGNGDGGGFSRISGKFLRSFAAVCLQGVMMIVCIRVFGEVMNAAITRGLANAATATTSNGHINELLMVMLLGSIVLVASVVKSGTWAKSLLDAA